MYKPIYVLLIVNLCFPNRAQAGHLYNLLTYPLAEGETYPYRRASIQAHLSFKSWLYKQHSETLQFVVKSLENSTPQTSHSTQDSTSINTIIWSIRLASTMYGFRSEFAQGTQAKLKEIEENFTEARWREFQAEHKGLYLRGMTPNSRVYAHGYAARKMDEAGDLYLNLYAAFRYIPQNSRAYDACLHALTYEYLHYTRWVYKYWTALAYHKFLKENQLNFITAGKKVEDY